MEYFKGNKKYTDKEIDVIRIVPNLFEKSVSLQKDLLNKLNELQIMVEERRSLLAGMLSNVKFIEKEDKSLQKKRRNRKSLLSLENGSLKDFILCLKMKYD